MCLHWYTKEFIPTYSIPGDKMFVREGVDKDIGHMPLPAMSLEELEKSPELYIVKIHKGVTDLPYKATSIFLVRDPHDVMVSVAHWQVWQRKFPTWRKAFDTIYNKRSWHIYCEKSLDFADIIVKYEDLVADPYGTVERVVSELDLPLTMMWRDMPTFEEMHEKLPLFFREGKVGSGREAFTPEKDAAFYARAGHMMDRLGYRRYF